MTDGSETRYTPAIRAEIERRWQNLPTAPAHLTRPLTFGTIGFEICQCTRWGDTWLSTHLHAQDDIQILLEGLATAERSLLAATARIVEVEACRREDCDRYTDALRRVGEANLELRRIIEEERKDRDDG